MPRVRQITQTLGIVGITFLIALALFLLFYFTGHGLLLALDILVLIPLGAILAFRFFASGNGSGICAHVKSVPRRLQYRQLLFYLFWVHRQKSRRSISCKRRGLMQVPRMPQD